MKRDSGLATRENLIEAATELFAKHGFGATSVQAIVEAAGATKGAFYHHFRSKDEVLVAIHERFVERELATLREIEGKVLSAAEALADAIEYLTAAHDEHGAEMAVFNRERHALHMPGFDGVRAQRAEVAKILDGLVERGVANGEFKPIASVRLAVVGIIGVTAWLYQWYEPGGAMNAREIGRFYARMIIDGLGADGPGQLDLTQVASAFRPSLDRAPV